jgi:hypothetical protein
MGRLARVVVLLACLVMVAHPAWAHDDAPLGSLHVASSLHRVPGIASPGPPPETMAAPHASPETAAPGLLLLLASIAMLAACTKPRRVLVGLLAFGLVLFSAEAAVHSVHHLGDREEASRCDVATIAGQLAAVPADAVIFDLALIAVGSAPPVEPPAPARRPLYSPNRGRSPPASPSA